MHSFYSKYSLILLFPNRLIFYNQLNNWIQNAYVWWVPEVGLRDSTNLNWKQQRYQSYSCQLTWASLITAHQECHKEKKDIFNRCQYDYPWEFHSQEKSRKAHQSSLNRAPFQTQILSAETSARHKTKKSHPEALAWNKYIFRSYWNFIWNSKSNGIRIPRVVQQDECFFFGTGKCSRWQ